MFLKKFNNIPIFVLYFFKTLKFARHIGITYMVRNILNTDNSY